MTSERMTLSVAQLNEYVRRTLASDVMLKNICITGEISNFKRHVSGHWYFTLKDEEAAINCVMFRQAAQTVRFQPENGMSVRLTGSVSLYVKTGSYQFYGERMEQEGLGELYLRFERLKQKLLAEGLFDPAMKKPLPLLPRGVGIVTSSTGAVVHDICTVTWRRNPAMPLYLCPVKVQGEGAAREIAAAIRRLDRMPEAEVLIVGRGGGSMEDLWPFNEEIVARAIAACRTPVVSAVGHETDFTIADFAADVRAATPSAAAAGTLPDAGFQRCGSAAETGGDPLEGSGAGAAFEPVWPTAGKRSAKAGQRRIPAIAADGSAAPSCGDTASFFRAAGDPAPGLRRGVEGRSAAEKYRRRGGGRCCAADAAGRQSADPGRDGGNRTLNPWKGREEYARENGQENGFF